MHNKLVVPKTVSRAIFDFLKTIKILWFVVVFGLFLVVFFVVKSQHTLYFCINNNDWNNFKQPLNKCLTLVNSIFSSSNPWMALSQNHGCCNLLSISYIVLRIFYLPYLVSFNCWSSNFISVQWNSLNLSTHNRHPNTLTALTMEAIRCVCVRCLYRCNCEWKTYALE